jgi:uncharacterized C2H2 Zn-finger protein
MEMTIEIPADNDGFVLLQCALCGEIFKVKPCGLEDDTVLEMRCPACGLISDNYFTDEITELAMTKAQNYAMGLLYDEMKKLERRTKGKALSFTEGKKPKEEFESPIQSTIEALSVHQYRCCNREVRIKPLLKIVGSYCPFCGVKEFETQ